MVENSFSGGCFCGKIRYKATAKPKYSTICYCADCRRAAGAGSVAWFTVPEEELAITEGAPVEYNSSPGVFRTFCGICGTSLTYRNTKRPGKIDITTASPDDPEECPRRLKKSIIDENIIFFSYCFKIRLI